MYGQQNTHETDPKEMAIKFYVLFVHSLSVKHPNVANTNAIESSRCTFQIRYITDFHISLFFSVFVSRHWTYLLISLCVFVFLCISLFSLIESEVKFSE